MWPEDVRPVTINVGRLATVSEAGAMLDCSERTVYRLIEAGKLIPVKIGARTYVTRASVHARAEVAPRGEA